HRGRGPRAGSGIGAREAAATPGRSRPSLGRVTGSRWAPAATTSGTSREPTFRIGARMIGVSSCHFLSPVLTGAREDGRIPTSIPAMGSLAVRDERNVRPVLEACYREAAWIGRETGNDHALSEALQELGNCYYRLGDDRKAYIAA